MCRLTLVILSLIAYNASAFDLNQHRVFSVLLLPGHQAAVGVVEKASGLAGFAVCATQAGRFENCQLNPDQRFSFQQMQQAEKRFAKLLGPKGQTAEEAGRELGFIAGLRLSPGQIAAYYGFKRLFGSDGLPEAVIGHYSRLFNTNLNSPPAVQFDAAGGAVTPSDLIEALQFAATAQK